MFNKLSKKISLSLITAVLFFTTVPLSARSLEEDKENELIEEVIDSEEIGEETDLSDEEEEMTVEKERTQENVINPRNESDPVTVNLEHVSEFRTYTNNYTGEAIPLFNLMVNFSINEDDLEGVKVEIPLDGYNVDSTNNTVFEHFTTSGNIFTLQPFTQPDPTTSAYKSVVYDEINNKIVIELNKTRAGVQNLNFTFKFNEAFDSIIPESQVIWENMHATVKVPSENKTYKYTSSDLTSTRNDNYKIELNRFNPTTNEYTGGRLVVRNIVRSNHFDFHETDFDNFDNKLFYEVPIGTKITNYHEFMEMDNPVTSTEDSSIPTGYVRYYGVFESDYEIASKIDSGASWNRYSHNDVEYMIDESLFSVGDTFEIRTGIVFKKYNAKDETVLKSLGYRVTAPSDWELMGNGYHSTGLGSETKVIVDIDDQNHTSIPVTLFSWSYYDHSNTVKNEGTQPITGVSYVLYNDSDSHAKLNFNSIQVFAMTGDNSVQIPSYEMLYEIKNVNGNSRPETTGIISKIGNMTHTPPALADGEYISKVTIVPVNSDGTRRNELQPKTAFSLRYTSKNWKGNKWPDGTDIKRTAVTNIPIEGTMFYNDVDGVQATKKMPRFNTQFARDIVVDAGVKVISSNSKDVKPGAIIDYRVQTTVGNQSLSDYRQPEITVGIPKELELVNAHLPKNFEDVKNAKVYEESVSVQLVSSDNKYNYYKLMTDNTGYKNGGLPSFNIPIQVKIKDGTPAGEYEFSGVVLSRFGGDFLQLTRAVNNATEETAVKFGHTNNDENYKYTYFSSTVVESVRVEAQTRIGARGAARASSTDTWKDVKRFAVEPNSKPETLSSIVNSGNTRFSTVKLYNILPFDGDDNKSTGSIKFTGIEAEGNPTIWYTTKNPKTLPAYGQNLQTWDESKLETLGFTKVAPEMEEVTAVFIDYGNAIIEPGKSFDTIMKFHVPNASNQTAYSQFQYSYEELDSTSAPVSPKSDLYMFSTESFAVFYNKNLPSFMLDGVTEAENMPENQSIMLDVDRKGSIVLTEQNDDKVPTIPGYKFTGWKLKDAATIYQPGDTITYVDGQDQIVELEAQWDAIDIPIKLFKNIDIDNDELVTSASYPFGGNIDFTTFADLSRTGFEFKGWSDHRQGGTILGVTNKVDFVNEKWFYANWDAHTYTVKYDANTGNNTMSDQSRAYDDQKTLLNNEFEKPGHTFVGWSETADGSTTVYSENQVINLTSDENAVITLYAQWKENTYNVKFDLKGGTGTAVDATKVYGEALDLPQGIIKTGYTFLGWAKDTDATTADYTTLLDVDLKEEQDAEVTLYAVWKANEYTVKFDLQGGTGTADSATKVYGKDLDLPQGITKVGYEFEGWATSANATTAEYTSKLTSDLQNTNGGEQTLYAVWKANEYTVKFDLQGGTGTADSVTKVYGKDLDLPQGITKVGYEFKGWATTANATTAEYTSKLTSDLQNTNGGEHTLYAVWQGIEYTIEFDVAGANETVASITKTYGTNVVLPTDVLTKSGHTFLGWATEADQDTAKYAAGATLDVDLTVANNKATLYAVWKANTYTVKFEGNGAKETVADKTKIYDASLTLPTVTKDGYTFLGWSADATATTAEYVAAYDEDLKSDQDDVLTLYAVWSVNTYTIVFDANGGEGSMDNFDIEYDVVTELPLNTFTKDTFNFIGWSKTADGDVVYTDGYSMDNEYTGGVNTLYAVWENKPTYHLDANDTEIGINELTTAINNDVLEETILTKTNARGYVVNSDGTKTEMPVFIHGLEKFDAVNTEDVIELTLSLKDPKTRGLGSEELDEADVSVLVTVSNDDKDTDKDNGGTKDPNTGIAQNSMLYILILMAAIISFLLLLKKRLKNR